MAIARLLWSLFLVVWLGAAFAVGSGESFLRGRSLASTNDEILCHIMEVDVQYDSGNGEVPSNDVEEKDGEAGTSLVCVTDTADGALDQVFDIDLPPTVLKDLELNDDSRSFVSVTNGVIDKENATIHISDNAQVSISSNAPHRRRLAPSIGVSTVLVLRVTYRGMAPTLSAEKLAGRVFGLGTASISVNLASQLDACSFGKLQFVPAQGEGIEHGVAEISIDEKVKGDYAVQALENLVVDKANGLFGKLRDNFQHVMMVMPDADLKHRGSSSYLAYGYLRGFKTVFRDIWAGRISALAHEIGHNLNLHHSGEGEEHYADMSGYMGYGSRDVGAPISCFNAQKHWSLGWFQDRSISLGLDDLPWGGYVAFFGDYNLTSPYDNVLVNVGRTSPRLFMQYNRATGINSGTRERKDQVVVVEDAGSPKDSWGLQSWMVAGIALDSADTKRGLEYSNFHRSGWALVIQVCEQDVSDPPDLVRLSIHLEDGVQGNTCNADLTKQACDDNKEATFFVDNIGADRPCGWLARNIDSWGDRLCVPGHEAYDLCEETCGKCRDDCEDTPDVTFYVNDVQGERDCEWLSSRPHWQERLCREEHDAYRLCPESCDICDRGVDLSKNDCDDDKEATFFVEGSGKYQNCWWLARNIDRWRDELCVPGTEAYRLCEETCGNCKDDCEDTPGITFHVNDVKGEQDCEWLSTRPFWQEHLCNEGHDAYRLCPESCDVCDRRFR